MTALGDFSPGDILTAADLNAIGEWVAFTPNWVGLTVGNGTQYAAYSRVNDIVCVQFSLTFGTTTSVGANARFDAPFNFDGYDIYQPVGVCGYWDKTVGIYTGHVVAYSQGFLFRRQLVVGSEIRTTNITSTAPFTWASTDLLFGSLTYRAA